MKTLQFLALWNAVLLSAFAQPLEIVTTQPDLWDLARRIGGAEVSVQSLTNGSEDLHLVRVRPSMLNRVRRADLFLQIGLSLEHAWVPGLLDASRNSKVQPGGDGFVNGAAGILTVGAPASLSREEGVDLHPEGNPHYNLDPERVRELARNIAAALKRSRPAKAADFEAGLKRFEAELDVKLAEWRVLLEPCRGAALLESHDTWVYFAERFGLRIVGRLEPKPGVAPTASHLASLVTTAQREKVRAVVAARGKSDAAEKVAEVVGARVFSPPTSSTLEGEDVGWIVFMDRVVRTFADALRP